MFPTRSPIRPGIHFPLGATAGLDGTNFAIYSAHATRMELCLFDGPKLQRETRISLPECTDHVWHGFVPGVKAGQVYGYRAHGPYEPEMGHRFNPQKVLLDPYAKAIGRPMVRWGPSLFGYRTGAAREDLSIDRKNSAHLAPLGMVMDTRFDWGGDEPPRVPWRETVIYEAHVKGFTKNLAALPEHLRGTYAGLASDQAIRFLKDLGITTVELLPVHHHLDDAFLLENGRTNYWGYNTLSFFAFEPEYAASRDPHEAMREFKGMVKRLHQAGLEVILDVVYNHTAEGSQRGPTLSLRGLDNASYYRLSPASARYCEDFTGCGNTVNTMNPAGLRLVMDSLRYWVTEMHVDGFRFDLASALAREAHGWDKHGSFFDAIGQDPVLSQVKLIAEPWDIGMGGYQVGNYPTGWAEWNGRYRDQIRRFWKGVDVANDAAFRFSGSADLYNHSGRHPQASINFITAHDGFCLRDLVSYNDKHNERNGEDNRDGANDNESWNCGHEGDPAPPEVQALRKQQAKNFIATLFLSQGAPMLVAGDERWHTQQGNNNTYCQDNELTWLSWDWQDDAVEMRDFTRSVIALRREEAVLSRKYFLTGQSHGPNLPKDVIWWNPEGREMEGRDWEAGFTRCFGMLLPGAALQLKHEDGSLLRSNTVLVLINGHYEDLTMVLPATDGTGDWTFRLTTCDRVPRENFVSGAEVNLPARSLTVFTSAPE
ncbi:glycogen debranching protein GlgX [Verrucomicrobium spinosum]|uniref:glycogen debranching protein GlgX n=1 Tax=Verrucomicrobium spinosum TaxID=2736 RepID=UPI0001745E82|nr:glycogen debranching protein GlgX [Verrucomicrobium spinosum]